MARALLNTPFEKVLGQFSHRETGAVFEWKEADTSWTGSMLEGLDINAEIFMSDGSTRFAIVKKTVAYVVVDEADDGSAVVEKWYIKENWRR